MPPDFRAKRTRSFLCAFLRDLAVVLSLPFSEPITTTVPMPCTKHSKTSITERGHYFVYGIDAEHLILALALPMYSTGPLITKC